MKKNMSMVDSAIRLVVAILIGFAMLEGALTGTAAIVLGIIAVILVVTAILRVCPLYMLFKFATNK